MGGDNGSSNRNVINTSVSTIPNRYIKQIGIFANGDFSKVLWFHEKYVKWLVKKFTFGCIFHMS
jgi:hypothetical protein